MVVFSKASPRLQPRGWQGARSQSPAAHLRPTAATWGSFSPAYFLGLGKSLNKRIREFILFLEKKRH